MSSHPTKITVGDSVFAFCVALVLTTLAVCLLLLLVSNLHVMFLFVLFPVILTLFYLPTQAILQKNKEDQRNAAKRGSWEIH